MSRQLAGFTKPAGGYPAYIAATEDENGVTIIVRGPAKDDGTCGSEVNITLTGEEFDEFAARVIASRRP